MYLSIFAQRDGVFAPWKLNLSLGGKKEVKGRKEDGKKEQ
jgi:hypothetical protein